MFNKKDASFEIAESMERALVTNAVDTQTKGLSKLAQAMEHLNAAAEIFDNAGLRKHAEAATQLLESLAAKKGKKGKKSKPPVKSKKSKKQPVKSKRNSKEKDSATEGLTSDKMLDNLEHKGWVFNADDGAEDESYAEDDNFVNHGDDCMCSSCMDSDDMNYLRHGDDCMCSMCMDADDSSYRPHHHGNGCMCMDCMDADNGDVNDMKLGITDRGPGHESPEYWHHMARKHTERNEFRKAEEAMKRALESERFGKYDAGDDSAFGDDFNFDFDTSKDSGYHVHRNPEKGYHLEADEADLFPSHRRY